MGRSILYQNESYVSYAITLRKKRRSAEFDVRNRRLKLLYYLYPNRTVLYVSVSITVR
jgi:hypothetical protein